MKPWQDFLETTSITAEILEKYIEMRLLLKEWGYTEESIKRISSAPNKLWELRLELTSKFEELKKQLEGYGFETPWNEVTNYLESKFTKINEVIPLNNGNN